MQIPPQSPTVAVVAPSKSDRFSQIMQRVGLWSSLVTIFLLIVTLLLNYVFVKSFQITTLNRLVRGSALVVQILGTLGLLTTIYSWWYTARHWGAMKLKEVLKDQAFDQGMNQLQNLIASPSAALQFGRGLVITAFGLATVFDGATLAGLTLHNTNTTTTPTQTSYHMQSQTHSSCQWGTGRPAVCQIQITNESTSNVTFDWVGTSSPAGASFSPDSGSIPPGTTSGTITVTDPFICPMTFQFVDRSHTLEIDSVFNSACQ